MGVLQKSWDCPAWGFVSDLRAVPALPPAFQTTTPLPTLTLGVLRSAHRPGPTDPSVLSGPTAPHGHLRPCHAEYHKAACGLARQTRTEIPAAEAPPTTLLCSQHAQGTSELRPCCPLAPEHPPSRPGPSLTTPGAPCAHEGGTVWRGAQEPTPTGPWPGLSTGGHVGLRSERLLHRVPRALCRAL